MGSRYSHGLHCKHCHGAIYWRNDTWERIYEDDPRARERCPDNEGGHEAEGFAPGQYPCPWLVYGYDEDGRFEMACDRPAWDITRNGQLAGFECEAGHSHIDAQTRQAEGWEYAESQDEAEALARAGVEPRTLDYGQPWPW